MTEAEKRRRNSRNDDETSTIGEILGPSFPSELQRLLARHAYSLQMIAPPRDLITFFTLRDTMRNHINYLEFH